MATALYTSQSGGLLSAPFNLTATGNIVDGVTGRRIRVKSLWCVASAALTVDIRDGNTTVIWGPEDLAAGGQIVFDADEIGHMMTTAGNALRMNITGAGNVGGGLTYDHPMGI